MGRRCPRQRQRPSPSLPYDEQRRWVDVVPVNGNGLPPPCPMTIARPPSPRHLVRDLDLVVAPRPPSSVATPATAVFLLSPHLPHFLIVVLIIPPPTCASDKEHDLRSWYEKLETSESLSPRTLLRVALRWLMMRDPLGDDGPEFPALTARATVTALSVLSTWYLHLFCGNSPVLAACATTLLVSTCIDRRLGRAALCGSLPGMSGGHLTPDLSAAVAFGRIDLDRLRALDQYGECVSRRWRMTRRRGFPRNERVSEVSGGEMREEEATTRPVEERCRAIQHPCVDDSVSHARGGRHDTPARIQRRLRGR
jgi:hypothetical protein